MLQRQILFRGQTRKKGQKVWMDGSPVDGNWVYGGIFPGTGDYSVIYGAAKENFTGLDLEKHVVYSDTVGQYTGLTDKNGTKVFEGDILRGSWNTLLVVFYEDISTSFKVKTLSGIEREISYYGLDRIEVIGNIHDNPELLKKDGAIHE